MRSLSRQSELFGKGDNYWTGPCWQPFNYLTLAALRRYSESSSDASFAQDAERAYQNLRSVVVGSGLREWRQSGMVYEQYSDEDGRGLKGKMFTGWSALLVLVISETYDGVV